MKVLVGLLLWAVSASPALAQTNFNEAYKAYQEAVAKGHFRLAARHAKKAYELGEQRFDADNPTLAALSLNLGNAMLAYSDMESERVLDRTLRMYERIYGRKAAELIDPLISLGHAENRLGSRGPFKRGRYDRAIKIAQDAFGPQDDIVIQINLDIGSRLSQRGFRESRTYLSTALDLTEAKYGLDVEQAIMPLFWMGKYHLANKSYRKAEQHFTNVADLFDAVEGGNKIEMAVTNRAFLVDALESQGKSDEATRHCRLIGQARAWNPNQEQKPIYQRVPNFPRAAMYRGQEGRVIVEFAVSPDGFVVEPEVVEVEGNEIFVKHTLDAFKAWRFAPKVVDGEPVKSERVRHGISFELAESGIKRGSTLSRFD